MTMHEDLQPLVQRQFAALIDEEATKVQGATRALQVRVAQSEVRAGSHLGEFRGMLVEHKAHMLQMLAQFWRDAIVARYGSLKREDVTFIMQKLRDARAPWDGHVKSAVAAFASRWGFLYKADVAKQTASTIELGLGKTMSRINAHLDIERQKAEIESARKRDQEEAAAAARAATVHLSGTPPTETTASELKREFFKPSTWIAALVVGIVLIPVVSLYEHAEWHAISAWFVAKVFTWTFLTIPAAIAGWVVLLRHFKAMTDIRIGYSYSMVPGWGWMPFLDIRNAPSAPRRILGNIKVMRSGSFAGYDYEELTGFDNSPMGMVLEPGSITNFKAGICSIADGKPGHPPTPDKMFTAGGIEAMNYHVLSQKFFFRTQDGLEVGASGPGNLRPAWKERLYQCRAWLDKHHLLRRK
jgi:hypothetical protein